MCQSRPVEIWPFMGAIAQNPDHEADGQDHRMNVFFWSMSPPGTGTTTCMANGHAAAYIIDLGLSIICHAGDNIVMKFPIGRTN